MRVNIVKRVDNGTLYSRSDSASAIGISPRTFDKYFRTDEFDSKSIKVGQRNVYLGEEINKRIDELIDGEHFVLSDSN
ncbi:TPA: hypothetical protein ACJUKZ_002738 [Staphylococcus aureus]|jgi:hypothetical protein|nr:Uncharacterised protein [Staphylococcus aureus]CAC8568275.1 Uncharacterised protein [Staphylococcus aureus]HDK4161448.1 hypothetical protein [Staphylococcus aureus]